MKKESFLKDFGNVNAPEFEYRNIESQSLNTTLFNPETTLAADVVIGSSLGGLIAYTFSQTSNIPCLVFNPALFKNSLNWHLTGFTSAGTRNKLAYIVLGLKDTIVSFKENLKYIEDTVAEPKIVVTEPELYHRIPIDVFEKHLQLFFKKMDLPKLQSG